MALNAKVLLGSGTPAGIDQQKWDEFLSMIEDSIAFAKDRIIKIQSSEIPLSVESVVTLVVVVAHDMILAAESYLQDIPGPERKVYVLASIDKLYSDVIAPIDIPFIPNILENYILDPIAGQLVHQSAGGIVDGIFEVLTAQNILLHQSGQPSFEDVREMNQHLQEIDGDEVPPTDELEEGQERLNDDGMGE